MRHDLIQIGVARDRRARYVVLIPPSLPRRTFDWPAMIQNTQRLTILAQDPAVRIDGKLVYAQVEIPHEQLAAGPTGYRVKVVDFDVTSNRYYEPIEYEVAADGQVVDPFALPARKMTDAQRTAWDEKLLADPTFHSQNVYVIVMRILARFEFALGRRVAWSFDGHQLHVSPHAFCDANAYYSRTERALVFGYFQGQSGSPVFTCLSHDIVAHETTHALLDGLRSRYMDPSGPDQAAFHEGFADVVALLSVFALKPIVELALTKGKAIPIHTRLGVRLVRKADVSREALADSILFGLGKQFGSELEGARANALRRSVKLRPTKVLLDSMESHDRGEIFAAVILRSFLGLWTVRIADQGSFGEDFYNLDLVIEQGAKIADQLLTMVIRAIDYCPVVDLEFGDFLAALLTVDREVVPDDRRFSYRDVIQATFAEYKISVPPRETDADGCWTAFPQNLPVTYAKTHFESMLRDREEVFRFIWENRGVLHVDDRGYTEVLSVRPSVRHGPDGFMLRETICEYVQIVELFSAEVPAVLGFPRPEDMPSNVRMTVYGGGVLIFDQYGRVKYHIERSLSDVARQSARLKRLWEDGSLAAAEKPSSFSAVHRRRVLQGD
jgi:hypothetical protein